MAWLTASVFAFLAAVLGQALILRCFGLRNRVVSFLLAGAPVGSLLIIAALVLQEPPDRSLPGLLLYGFLCEIWLFAFTFVFSSISANLLMHLRREGMNRAEIDGLYDSRAMIQTRIDALCGIGTAAKRNGQLVPTEKGKRLASVFNAARAFFGHP